MNTRLGEPKLYVKKHSRKLEFILLLECCSSRGNEFPLRIWEHSGRLVLRTFSEIPTIGEIIECYFPISGKVSNYLKERIEQEGEKKSSVSERRKVEIFFSSRRQWKDGPLIQEGN